MAISTRILIISDTHSEPLKYTPSCKVDVAIHCGDLTEESKIYEYEAAVTQLKAIDAPLKLVIGGNHDFTLDDSVFKQSLKEIRSRIDDDELIEETYGRVGAARELLEAEDVKAARVVFLDEGTHHFHLKTGATLTVYASSFTPSKSSGWGFTYDLDVREHDWNIGEDVDIAITHGPAKGVLDHTDARQRAGSGSLFAAIARAKPKIHCFGHIHEAWGSKLVTWREEISEPPSHFTDIDNDESPLIENLPTLKARRIDSQEVVDEKAERFGVFARQGYRDILDTPIRPGEQTLFVNAAIEGTEEGEQHLPWVVEVELSAART